MSTITGYRQDTEGAYIVKDRLARLIYTMDWSDYLAQGVAISSVTYSLQTRANDPTPIVQHSSGVQSGTKTYVEISAGAVNKTYTVTAAVTFDNGETDRRSFRLKIENKSA